VDVDEGQSLVSSFKTPCSSGLSFCNAWVCHLFVPCGSAFFAVYLPLHVLGCFKQLNCLLMLQRETSAIAQFSSLVESPLSMFREMTLRSLVLFRISLG
jgi:hypothetical protein